MIAKMQGAPEAEAVVVDLGRAVVHLAVHAVAVAHAGTVLVQLEVAKTEKRLGVHPV